MILMKITMSIHLPPIILRIIVSLLLLILILIRGLPFFRECSTLNILSLKHGLVLLATAFAMAFCPFSFFCTLFSMHSPFGLQ